jgi:prepilin-type N-terminal cleavage/methylation domain-containing protein
MRRLRRIARDESGFTLTEMIIVVAILGVVLGGVTTVFISGSRAELSVNRRFQAQEAARLALASLRRDVHNACTAKVTGTAPALTLTLSIPVTYTGTNPATPPIPKEQCGTVNAQNITKVIWCAIAMTNPSTKYRLYRSTTGTCTTSSKLVADNLVTSVSNPTFSGFFQTTPGGQLGFGQYQTVDVDIPVSFQSNDSGRAFRLTERVSLRNTVWATTAGSSCSASVPCIPGPCDQLDVAGVPIPCYPPVIS